MSRVDILNCIADLRDAMDKENMVLKSITLENEREEITDMFPANTICFPAEKTAVVRYYGIEIKCKK